MRIRQYNFIYGSVASGKTLFCKELIKNLGNKTIIYNIDGNTRTDIPNTYVITLQNANLSKLLKEINCLNENNFEMTNIVIDSVSSLPDISVFCEFISQLPKNNRYFFTIQTQRQTGYLSNVHKSLIDYLPLKNISKFYVKTDGNNNIVIENNGIEFQFGDIKSIFRNMRINQIITDSNLE